MTITSLPADVVVCGGGTAGVVAALAAARRGARTVLVEAKGYTGGIAVEGGTALHSFYNLWKAFPGVAKRQVVWGIPQEIVDRLLAVGGCTGHAEVAIGADYDSVCTAVDVERYKLVSLEMLEEAGVGLKLNTLCTGAVMDGDRVAAVVTESRSGREEIGCASCVDCTGYGDLAAHAGAAFTEPNDHPVANSIGVGGVSIEGYRDFLAAHDAISQYCEGPRGGAEGRIIRLDGDQSKLPAAFVERIKAIGMSLVITALHDDQFMFLKLNYRTSASPVDRDVAATAEVELRRRQAVAIDIFREWIPGCEQAYIARSSPSLCIRRGRCIRCDHDLTLDEILGARHVDDEVMVYGFHDCAPRLQIAGGGTYGIPYRALRPAGIANLLVAGMLITSDWKAHMSTRNTVCCMGQGQAAGTAAALCADRGCGTRELPADDLRAALLADGVYLED